MILLPLVEETFSSEIKLCYQKRESNYKNIVTVKSGIVGDSTYFNKSNAGTEAGKKARFGKIPRNGGSLDRVKCELETYYASDEIDEQEVDSTSANGMLVITDNAMASMEQKIDSLILTAMDSTTNIVDEGAATGMTKDKAKLIRSNFVNAHVFKNKETPVVYIGSAQWDELMDIDEFYKAESIGYDRLPYIFTEAETGRLWLDMIWRCDPDLPVANDVRKCFAFVKSAIGLAYSGINKTRLVETEDDTILYYARQKVGSVLIDGLGCQEIQCDESAST